MVDRLIRFFLENQKFNYTLFIFIIVLGSYSYMSLPKEKFPVVDLDRILVNGAYGGSSNELLDKMAVSEIEDSLKSVEGIKSVTSVIRNNSFSIVNEIEDGANSFNIYQKIKDAVTSAKQNLPSDMSEPTVKLIERSRAVISVALNSDKLSFDELIDKNEEIKNSLLAIDGVASVGVDGDSDKFVKILIDSKKLEAYGLDKNLVANAIKNLSYIYPLGKIEDSKYHFYLTTFNGKKEAKEIENTLLKIAGKSLYLRDIASVEKRYEDYSKISNINLERSIIFNVKKYEDSNALDVAKLVKEFVDEYSKDAKDLKLSYFLDDSRAIRNRLNNVTSNIFLGLILVFLSLYILVNKKIALVVSIGVPTSFFIAFIAFYIVGLSINLVSLLALLIALGVLVDDAIIVSENIQRHIENGLSVKEASYIGAKEVLTPVTMASLTTMFTFLPLLALSGTMGLMIKMIPIGVTLLVLASYLESFLFLPIHAMHSFKKGDRTTSWAKVLRGYSSLLEFFIRFKKSFLFIFFILVPLLIVFSAKNSKFQLFPRVDIPIIYLSGKLNESSNLEQSNEAMRILSEQIMQKSKELSIKNISTSVGYRVKAIRESETGENLFYILLEMYELEPQNFVDKFITPYLSFEYDASDKIRETKTRAVIKEINKIVKANEKTLGIEEFEVFQRRIGIKVDIEIGVVAENTEKIFFAIDEIEKKLKDIKGLSSISNNAFLGLDEVKLKINRYGESLGVSEGSIALVLSNYFQSNKKALTFDSESLLDIVIEDSDKDSLERIKNLNISLDNGAVVKLYEICDFVIKKTLNSIDKQDFHQMKSIYINVDSKIVTASEVLEKLEPKLNELRDAGFKFNFKGEKEKNKELANDLSIAGIVAIFLIFLALLYMFGTFRYTFMIISVIPFSIFGVFMGHFIMGENLTMPSLIGAFGLAGVVINDSIVMLDFLRKSKTKREILENAKKRFRPIILTSLTTLIGLSTLIFFVSGQAKILQPIAISLGFGLAWGTILNLLYLPVLFSLYARVKE